VVECVSVINTGAKYNTDVFKFSVGLNGVGTKAVNALSTEFSVSAFRDGKYKKAVFDYGTLQKEKSGNTDEANGTLIEFQPDPELFPDFQYDRDFIEQRLWRYAYLNTGLQLYLDEQCFFSENGLLDLLDIEVNGSQIYEPVYHKGNSIEFSFTHTDDYGDTYYSFVNGTYTSEGGTHLSAFREGILKGVNEFSGKKFSSKDVRDGVVGTLAVKVQEPIFESQT
jgi:topoisomerase-4 subunit B